MIQAFGLTSTSRKARPPAVDDVSFEARAGRITVLLGAVGAGKTTALRLMLALRPGRGITYFRGRPLYRIAHPAREVGVLLGDVPGHPARSVRGHLRMLCAASGVPGRRADEVLEAVGLVSFREERLGTLSRGMDRRLGLACALLPDPHTLVLDDPTRGLSPGEAQWLHGMLRAHADQGGTVLTTTGDPREAARIADRVVTLDAGRLVADQAAGEFARTRLRPRVAVRSPYAGRLAAALTKEARTGRRSVEVVREGGNRLSVYGTTTSVIGETAFRHGILVHQLADEIGDMGPGSAADNALPERAPAMGGPAGGRTPPEREKTVFGFSVSDPITMTRTGSTTSTPSSRQPPRPNSPAAQALSTAPAPTPAAPTPAAPAPSTEPADAAHRAETRATGDAETTARHPGRPETGPRRLTHTRIVPTRIATTRISALRTLLPGARGPFARPSWTVDPETRTGGNDHSARSFDRDSPLPPPISVRPAPTPLRPLRYEIRRAAGVGTGFLICGAVLALSVLTAVALAGIGHTPQARLFAAWPRELPLPPVALAAGLLGALAFGDEFRHPALAADRGTVPRRLGLLTAKLLVSGATAALLAFLVAGCDAEALYLVYGKELTQVPEDWLSLSASWIALVIGCAWAGVLAAGVFRSTSGGLAAVLAVPVAVVPLMHTAFRGPAERTVADLPSRTREVFLLQWPFGGDRYLLAVARLFVQPVGGAMVLSLAALLCAYLFTTLRARA
ncbi:ATP-binding cassette domain-containing protein [Streptomyces sp. LaBMicrA B280]|uniref:ABC transporter ATP-binding protein n=1 Tax=Streptomyces sp. LaBMicrA B280 TaxID=3391001 RepID=UPI003BA744BE